MAYIAQQLIRNAHHYCYLFGSVAHSDRKNMMKKKHHFSLWFRLPYGKEVKLRTERADTQRADNEPRRERERERGAQKKLFVQRMHL